VAKLQLHSGRLQVGGGGGRERRGHGGQHPVNQVDQDNPAITLTELLEIALNGPVHQLDQGPGQLATGGACSHHHHLPTQSPFQRQGQGQRKRQRQRQIQKETERARQSVQERQNDRETKAERRRDKETE
jgi:hypothetical protein